MKIIAAIIFTCFIFGCSSVKPGNAKENSIGYQDTLETRKMLSEELLNSMNMDSTLQQLIDTMLSAQIQQNPALELYKEILKSFFNKYMSYESLKPDFIKIYAESYTSEELSDIVAFYKSKTGSKLIKTMPALMEKGAKVGQLAVQGHQDELVKMIKEQAEKIEHKSSQEKH